MNYAEGVPHLPVIQGTIRQLGWVGDWTKPLAPIFAKQRQIQQVMFPF